MLYTVKCKNNFKIQLITSIVAVSVIVSDYKQCSDMYYKNVSSSCVQGMTTHFLGITVCIGAGVHFVL